MSLNICSAAHIFKHCAGCVESHTDSGRVGRVHRRGAVVPEDEVSSEPCLHCEINEVVREHIEGQHTVNIAELAARMAESLVDLIFLTPEEERGSLLAEAIAHLGHAFLEKSGASEGRSGSAH
jgi:hypothetical protein